MRHLVAALLIAPTALMAETPMTASEFEAYVTGKTLTYAEGGIVYGIEEYLPNRRVRWAFTEDECREGEWFEAGEAICFVYEDNLEPQCWTFYDRPGGLAAKFENVDDGRELYEIGQSPEPLFCPGPEVGV
ncbi:hypothetical protein [Anianabacter salinae]|uniref:hypothetical protein n=1 Tax=Anianabacter salinae TaxID=2851023 RepID=UPI00225E058C|nr:hypothetical protein [Anianabacter salinae]MBV0913993.1 hypothetical protein [Anianabacter salinae]